MKVIDRYIIGRFTVTFFTAFFVVVFVLVMQLLWLAFDGIAGRDIDISYILKFLFYTSLQSVPMAIPITVLLASIMVMGNLSEGYELSALKASGVSLRRVFRPLIWIMGTLSIFTFLFLNFVYPYASFRQRNLWYGMQKQRPALSLVEGTFNNDIPGYSIKFEKKYGPQKNLLKSVHILDLRTSNKNDKIIKAKRGEIYTEEGSKYMTLKLYDGYYFEDHTEQKYSDRERKKMPASYAHFDTYDVNFDISDFVVREVDSDDNKSHYMMLDLHQLSFFSDSLTLTYKEYLRDRSYQVEISSNSYQLFKKSDTLINKQSDTLPVFDNLLDYLGDDTTEKIQRVNMAIAEVDAMLMDFDSYRSGFKDKRKWLNLYDFEYYRRVAFSLSPLLLFLIGAPLGSLIRKGGLGTSFTFAIVIFVAYYIGSSLGKNMSEESSVTASFAAWISTLVFTPLAVLLTRRATKGIGAMVSFEPYQRFFKKLVGFFKKRSSKINTHEKNTFRHHQ